MGYVNVAQGTLYEIGSANLLNLKPFPTNICIIVKLGRGAFKNNAAMSHDQRSV